MNTHDPAQMTEAPPPMAPERSFRKSLGYSFRAFYSRNYRVYFIGQSISLIGTWMQRVAMGWLIYRLTNSAFLLGLIGFTSLAPTFFIGLLGGVLADRWSRHRLLIITQSLAMVQAFILAVLTLSGVIQVWHIIVLSIYLGIVTAIDAPVRQAFIVQLVDRREDLSNAIALNSTGFHIAQLIGPSLAGILSAAYGEGICFLLNAIAFTAVLFSLFIIRIRTALRVPARQRVLKNLAEGLRYSWNYLPIRVFVILQVMFGLFGFPYSTVMPIFARDMLSGGADTLGYLMAAAGTGAITGSLFLASRTGAVGMGRLIPVSVSIFGLGIVAFSQSTTMFISLGIVAIVGGSQQLILAGSNTVVQTVVDEDKRGRVMSLFMIAGLGVAPFGNLLTGSVAELIGAPTTLAINGSILLLSVVYFALRMPKVRAAARSAYERAEQRDNA